MAANKKLSAQLVGYLALSGSKDFFAGLDKLPANFEQKGEKEQEKDLALAQAEGEKRRKAHNNRVAELAKQGKVLSIDVTVNGTTILGEVVWNKEQTGLMARIACPCQTTVTVTDKKTTKKRVASFLGI